MELRMDEGPSTKGPGVICKAPSATPTGNPTPQGRRRLHCTVENCGYSTLFSKDLGRHMRKHTGERPYTCPHCPNKAFSRHDKLSLHLRTHAGLRPHHCPHPHCDYSALDAHSLRRHSRTHSNLRPYQCTVCSYAAKEHGQLSVHLRSHTGHCPFSCPEPACDATFKTPSDLKRHARVHNGEKPFPCPLCSYRASVKCNLNTHLRKIHGQHQGSKNGGSGRGQAPTESPVLPPDTEEEELPFQYACKKCPFKADTLPLFNVHMREKHCEETTFLILPIASPKKKGRPRKKEAEESHQFLCEFCKASFSRKEALLSHLKQHEKDKTLPASSAATEWEFIVFNTE